VMGCTEVPLALEPLTQSERQIGVPLIDSNAALARGCVAWARSTAPKATAACA
jgi:aspartate/glutamate racemase